MYKISSIAEKLTQERKKHTKNKIHTICLKKRGSNGFYVFISYG